MPHSRVYATQNQAQKTEQCDAAFTEEAVR